jgi:trk system potassium uptake protein TrkA
VQDDAGRYQRRPGLFRGYDLGEVGFHIASRLAIENRDVVVVDIDARALRRVSDHIDVKTVHGSGSSPVALEEAGLKEADIILALVNSDEINLVACLVADILSPSIKKLARLRNTDFDDYLDSFSKDSLAVFDNAESSSTSGLADT